MRNGKHILLVEDDEIDRETTARAFKDIKVPNRLDITTNGEEALSYLRTNAATPCLILLDLNMPRMDGMEFLKVKNEDFSLKKIPVVVLTTSSEKKDISEAFLLGAAGYMVKPIDYLEFVKVIKGIDHYWTLSQLPD